MTGLDDFLIWRASSPETSTSVDGGGELPPVRPVPSPDAAPMRQLAETVWQITRALHDYADVGFGFHLQDERCHWVVGLYDPDNHELDDLVMAAVCLFPVGGGVEVYCPNLATRLPPEIHERLLGVMVRLTRKGVRHLYPAPYDPIDDATVAEQDTDEHVE